MINCFTISSKNYMALAINLGSSIVKQNPNYSFTIFLADEATEHEISNFQSPFNIILVSSISIENLFFFSFKYDVIEFNTAIKPYCFSYLFNQGANKVAYFDPDIQVYSNLSEIENILENKSFANLSFSSCFLASK